MMDAYRAGEVALGASMCVVLLSTSLFHNVLTLCDISVATTTETCIDVEIVR
jgi:hypothetical protein